MKKIKPSKPPCKFLIKLGYNFYAKGFLKKKISLFDNGMLRKIEPPYIAVVNHCSLADVISVGCLLYPKTANFVASKTQFAKYGNILKKLGVLPKKQFSVDATLIKNIKHLLKSNCPVVIYPEGKLSVDGTPNPVQEGIAKLVKMMKVPLVSVCFSGSYLFKPKWSETSRFVPIVPSVKVAVKSDEIKSLSVGEIHRRIVENLTYDDFVYQLENKIEIVSDKLLDGVENVLFMCPECRSFHNMVARGNNIWCEKCGYLSRMDKYGVLTGKFSSIPLWYKFQKETVLKMIESNEYKIDVFCNAEKQTKNKFAKLKGQARLVHNEKGIFVTLASGEELSFPRGLFYTLSFSNKYIFLPTNDAVFRFSFDGRVSGITALLNLAVEEYSKREKN